jgi:NAD(P)-dependent dehydrogenase (short-subunit alcohol dehydrogenase family)
VRSRLDVVATGASRGIGKQVALACGRLGMNVVVAARTVEQTGRRAGTVLETAEAIRSAGGTALAVRADMTDAADIQGLVREAVSSFGGVDVPACLGPRRDRDHLAGERTARPRRPAGRAAVLRSVSRPS